MMDGSLQGSVRDARGRFVPGQSGNPAGKAPGTCNRATLLKAALESEEGPAMARIVIDKALSGDVVTARFCLDRLEPRPRGRAITIDLPEGARANDVVAAFDATLRAMASGEITPDEAVQVTRVLDGRRKAIEAARRETERTERRDEEVIVGAGFNPALGEASLRLTPSAVSMKPREARARTKFAPPSPVLRTPREIRAGQSPAPTNNLGSSAALGDITPHPPIADAMGPPERLSKDLSRPFDKSSGGRGARFEGSVTANLLHSTCISSPSGVMGWAAREKSGAAAAMALA
jgi:hypothetical protein